ncbi:MAG: hypothetical protein WCQ69_08140 [Bacteroidales bacterium]|jgi:hypothetical protein
MNIEYAITHVCNELEQVLLEKNKAYGNSVANPVRIFSKADPIEQINVRLDDKLSRLMRGHEYPGDDTEFDLMGYLVLKRAIKLKEEANNNGMGECE